MDTGRRAGIRRIEQELIAEIQETERRLIARGINPILPWNVRPTLLYVFMQLFEVLGRNVCLTTYVERGWMEYFAGFSNVYLVETPALDGPRMQGHRWLSVSLIFRASRSQPF